MGANGGCSQDSVRGFPTRWAHWAREGFLSPVSVLCHEENCIPTLPGCKSESMGGINIGTQPKRKALKIFKNISFSPLPVEVEIGKCVFMDIENTEYPRPPLNSD